jgi:hypothetical protein
MGSSVEASRTMKNYLSLMDYCVNLQLKKQNVQKTRVALRLRRVAVGPVAIG